jgi:predicted transcriptional regulator
MHRSTSANAKSSDRMQVQVHRRLTEMNACGFYRLHDYGGFANDMARTREQSKLMLEGAVQAI